jgi:hypothetical protein
MDRTLEGEASEEAVFSSQQAGDLFQLLLSSGPAMHEGALVPASDRDVIGDPLDIVHRLRMGRGADARQN